MSGIPGYKVVRVDHLGYINETIGKAVEPIDGNNIVLTLNWKAQRIAEKLLKGDCGTFVLLDADTGAVLAMASAPTFDLKNFAPRVSAEAIAKLSKNPDIPMLNRATQGQYMPGSIIKPLIALALLENGLNPNDVVHCDGKTQVGDAVIRCTGWKIGGHGDMRLLDAIQHSCNDYFIENGIKLGLEKITAMLGSAGIGKTTGFCLDAQSGLLPSSEYKLKNYGYPWNKYDTAMLSIGQGIILLTPLQAAVYCAALANGGTVYRPYLLKEIQDRYGNVLFRNHSRAEGRIGCRPENLELVKKGMRLVVASPDGSGSLANNPAIELYGKTGTAEVTVKGVRYNNTWFICFGTHKGKTYAAAILIERGGSGGKSCAPLAARFFTEWLEDK